MYMYVYAICIHIYIYIYMWEGLIGTISARGQQNALSYLLTYPKPKLNPK